MGLGPQLSRKVLRFSAFTLALFFLISPSTSHVASSEEAAAAKSECPPCPVCKECPACPQCVDCAQKDSQLRQCEEKFKQLETDKSVAVNNLSTARSELKVAQDGLASCNAAKAEMEGDQSSCSAVEAERDTLMASRLELATSLEKAESREAQLATAKKELEAKVETLSKSTEALVAAEKAKTDLEEQVSSQSTTISKLERQLEASRTENDRLQAALQTAEADLNSLEEYINSKVTQHDRTDHLFSLSQLVEGVKSFWMLTKSTTIFVATKSYNAILTKIPSDAKEKMSKLWADNTDKVSSFWKSDIHPRFDNTMRSLSSNQLTRVSLSMYEEKIAPQAYAWLDHAKAQVSQGSMVSAAYLSLYVDIANKQIDSIFVNPLVENFPEVQPLIPSGFVDRMCLVAFVSFVLTQIMRHASFIMWILVLAVKLALPCCWCGLCARRANPTTAAKNSKNKTKKPRKSFLPAAAANASAPNSGQGKALGGGQGQKSGSNNKESHNKENGRKHQNKAL